MKEWKSNSLEIFGCVIDKRFLPNLPDSGWD